MPADLTSLSDEELARQSQEGSMAAFEELVYRYERRVYAFVCKCCHCGADAGDLVQESFIKAFQAIALYNPRFTFAAWLFTIARRKCIDRYRAQPREPELFVLAPDDLPDPGEVLARSEDSSALWNLAAKRLFPAQYEALWLRYSQDLDVAEIACVLRKTRTHVKVLLFRARQSLARELEAAGQGISARSAAPGSAGFGPGASPGNIGPRNSTPGRLGFSLAGRKEGPL